MSTNSSIAVIHADGTITQVTCHWDGHLSEVGASLKARFNSLELAEALVARGNLSTLDLSYFEWRQDEITCERYVDFAEFTEERPDYEFNYIFINGEWFCAVEGVSEFSEY